MVQHLLSPEALDQMAASIKPPPPAEPRSSGHGHRAGRGDRRSAAWTQKRFQP